jgi:hypothetical protein
LADTDGKTFNNNLVKALIVTQENVNDYLGKIVSSGYQCITLAEAIAHEGRKLVKCAEWKSDRKMSEESKTGKWDANWPPFQY